jgi:glycosyltransferase involved in cell wall biosynthesis
MRVTIALCTRNNCASLLNTLGSLDRLRPSLPTELLIVDNGSTDGTRDALSRYSHATLPTRKLREETRGLCWARNLALASSQGDIVVFTDDDVRVPPEWIDTITRPLLEGRAEATVGGITIASNLVRPWMTRIHRALLASTDALEPEEPRYLIGANMAFLRSVTAKVPEFDVELGAGRLGGWDETLFSWQLKAAGFRLKGVFDHPIEHHFNPSRLSRTAFLSSARVQGRSRAYVDYHWHHARRPSVREALKSLGGLVKLRVRSYPPAREGIGEEELRSVEILHEIAQWARERQRPRHYEKHGLRRLPNV